MAFILHDFVLSTLRGMVGNEPEYKIRQYALGWYDRAELTAEDMDELELAITPPVTVEDVAADVDQIIDGLEGLGATI